MLRNFQQVLIVVIVLLLVLSIGLCGYAVSHLTAAVFLHSAAHGDPEALFVALLPVALLVVTVCLLVVYKTGK